jgi:dolichol-phosphate mannosyltransferase
MTELSIVLPTYQDAETLPRAIEGLHGVITHASIFAEVLIVDDESTDETVKVASELAERFPALHIRVFARTRRRHGFGGLVRFGLAHATGRYAALVSSDGRDPVGLLPEMLKKLRSGAQLVLCSRYLRSEDSKKVAIRYRLYQVIYRQAVRWLLARELTDTTYEIGRAHV